MTLLEASLICLVALAINLLEVWLAFPMVYMPLVLGPVVGLIMGDLTTGILCGAACQIFFLGFVGLGNAISPDGRVGTVIGTALAISMGQGMEVAVILAILGSFVGQGCFILQTILRNGCHKKIERMIERADYKALERYHPWVMFWTALPGVAANFIVIYFGGLLLQNVGTLIPTWVITGLGVFISLVGTLAIASLLRMMWSNKMAVYFVLGFVLVAFFNVPLIGVLCIGIVIITILYQETNKNAPTATANTAPATEDEALFDD